MKTDYDTMLQRAYGPFVPDSTARLLRTENAKRGFRTCWFCLAAYRPERVTDDEGRLHQLGRGRYYCSPECARADRGESVTIAEFPGDGTLVLDLRRCSECAA